YRPDPAKAAEAKARAEEQPAAGLAGGELARFYYRRGLAAGEIGRLPQQLADLRRAVEVGGVDTSFMLQALGSAEFLAGNPANAIRVAEQRIAIDDRAGVRGRLLSNYAALVRYNVARGNLDEATRWTEKLRAAYAT